MSIPREAIARFNEKIEMIPFHECWEWIAGRNSDGYGGFWLRGKTLRASRVSWLIFLGAIPEGKIICHTCDNPGCVNPKHLFLGSQKDNMIDKASKGRSNVACENNGGAKLKKEQIDEIMSLKNSGLSQKLIGKRFGVYQSQISRLWNGKRWSSYTNLVEK